MALVKHLNEMIEFPKEGVLSKTVSETDSGEIDLFMMPKGERISGHAASRDAAVHVLRGEVDFRVGQEWHHLKPGDLLYMEAGLEHELAAREDLVFVLTLFGS
ncbi:MAG: cupin domain-containing protein [Armatimonadetes bacterium]|nr:cupin domain-containing protein [Armatimonadota bacterium]